MSVPAKKNLKNSTSQIALNTMHLRKKAEEMVGMIFLQAHKIFPTSYHNRWFRRREFDELIEIAEEISNEGITLQGVAKKLKEGNYSVYATSKSAAPGYESRRPINASLADIEQLEAEAAMYIAQGQMQLDLLIKAFETETKNMYEVLRQKQMYKY